MDFEGKELCNAIMTPVPAAGAAMAVYSRTSHTLTDVLSSVGSLTRPLCFPHQPPSWDMLTTRLFLHSAQHKQWTESTYGRVSLSAWAVWGRGIILKQNQNQPSKQTKIVSFRATRLSPCFQLIFLQFLGLPRGITDTPGTECLLEK